MGVDAHGIPQKVCFYRDKGFSSHLNLQSGDDDLFINETTKPKQCIEISKIVQLFCPQNNPKYWFNQKENIIFPISRHYKFQVNY